MSEDEEWEPVPPPRSRKMSRENIETLEAWADATPRDVYAEAVDDEYHPDYCELIKVWAGDCMFPEEWAAALEVSEATLYSWIRTYPEFTKAYTIAATKLRATFTALIMKNAKSPSGASNGPLLKMIAERRFADLFGPVEVDPTKPPPQQNPFRGPRDPDVIEHEDIKNMKREDLEREIEEMMQRRAIAKGQA